MSRSWRFVMSGTKPPLSMNDRLHWRTEARLTKSLREEAYWRARAARIPRLLTKISVEITWVVPDRTRRDADNPTSSAKAVYDGLVDAGIVADDTPEFMEKKPVKIEYRKGERMWFVTVVDLSPEGA